MSAPSVERFGLQGSALSTRSLVDLQVACSPHPGKPQTVMTQYRRHILSCKKRWGTARGLIHYRQIVDLYLLAKRASSNS